jgi:Polyketide cyclase / dehydrase and lipid transport
MNRIALLWVLAGIIGVVFTGGTVQLLAPSAYRVERSIIIEGNRLKVWRAVRDLSRWQSWSPWLNQDPHIKLTRGPRLNGVGAWRRWQSSRLGSGRLEFTAVDSSSGSLSYTATFDGWPSYIGTIQLTEQSPGTLVTWWTSGELNSPASRLFGLMMDGMMGPDLEEGLLSLKRLVEAPEPSATQ